MHVCELCIGAPDTVIGKTINPAWAGWAEPRSSNGEIRVAGNQIIFAAPVLIVHYIEEHGYLPPAEFLEAVTKAG